MLLVGVSQSSAQHGCSGGAEQLVAVRRVHAARVRRADSVPPGRHSVIVAHHKIENEKGGKTNLKHIGEPSHAYVFTWLLHSVNKAIVVLT